MLCWFGSGCKFCTECSFPHWKVEEQPNKRPKKGGDKSAVTTVRNVRRLGGVSKDAEPPESSTILRKGSKILGPIRRVRFTRAPLCQANIRDNKGLSLNKIQVKLPHQRSPYAMKFEIGLRRRLKDRNDAPAETRGDLPRVSIISKKKTRLHSFHLPMRGFCRPHPL